MWAQPRLANKQYQGKADVRADVWGLGATLYELLTLERPFTGSTNERVFEAIRLREYRPIRELRPELALALADVIDRARTIMAERAESLRNKFGARDAKHQESCRKDGGGYISARRHGATSRYLRPRRLSV